MKSKTLFASMFTTLSLLAIVPVAANAYQNDARELPAREPGAHQPARINTLVVASEQDGCANLAYPGMTVRDAPEGRVKLRYMVDAQGRARDANVVRSSGSSRIDNASLSALSKCIVPQPDRQAAAAQTWHEVVYVWSRD